MLLSYPAWRENGLAAYLPPRRQRFGNIGRGKLVPIVTGYFCFAEDWGFSKRQVRSLFPFILQKPFPGFNLTEKKACLWIARIRNMQKAYLSGIHQASASTSDPDSEIPAFRILGISSE